MPTPVIFETKEKAKAKANRPRGQGWSHDFDVFKLFSRSSTDHPIRRNNHYSIFTKPPCYHTANEGDNPCVPFSFLSFFYPSSSSHFPCPCPYTYSDRQTDRHRDRHAHSVSMHTKTTRSSLSWEFFCSMFLHLQSYVIKQTQPERSLSTIPHCREWHKLVLACSAVQLHSAVSSTYRDWLQKHADAP